MPLVTLPLFAPVRRLGNLGKGKELGGSSKQGFHSSLGLEGVEGLRGPFTVRAWGEAQGLGQLRQLPLIVRRGRKVGQIFRKAS